ncbi:MAG: HNH endonuclease [bacterium]
MNLQELFKAVGKHIFVKYYYYFKDSDRYLTTDMLEIIKEDYTEKSKKSRTGHARMIFNNGWNIDALETIQKSNVAPEIQQQARAILKKERSLKNTNITQLNEVQIFLAEELLKTVANQEPNVSYEELAKRVTLKGINLHHRQVGRNIGEVSKLCYELGLPLLSAKVMNKNSKIAGEGFFELYKALDPTITGDSQYLFKKELEKIRKCTEWHKLTEYLNIKVSGISIEPKNTNNIEDSAVFPEEVDLAQVHYEGSLKTISVNIYERNPKAKAECIKHYGSDYKCQVCGFKFSDKYGAQFKNKIHIHHIKPLSEIGKEYIVNPETDLIPVCPNCHMILHSKGKNETYTIEEVKEMLKETTF